MLRFIALLATIALGHELSGAGELVSESEIVSETEVIGTWRIEPSTFTVYELAKPNTNPRPQLPTNYNTFALVLKKDGRFVATNVPARLFCDLAAMEACSGEWSTWTNSIANTTNMYSHFSLLFQEPHLGHPPAQYCLWGRRIRSWRKNSSAPPKLALHIGPIKDASNTYEWNLLLTKQE